MVAETVFPHPGESPHCKAQTEIPPQHVTFLAGAGRGGGQASTVSQNMPLAPTMDMGKPVSPLGQMLSLWNGPQGPAENHNNPVRPRNPTNSRNMFIKIYTSSGRNDLFPKDQPTKHIASGLPRLTTISGEYAELPAC